MTMDVWLRIVVGVVAVHTGLTVLHSIAHLNLGIVPPPADLAFILVVFCAAPVAAAVLRWRGPRRPADFLLAASLLAALIYGILFHAVLPGSDNFGTIPSSAWGFTFVATGFAISIVEVAGVAVAVADARR